MPCRRYIENLEYEINHLIQKESEGLTYKNEETLHKLFENLKHVKEYVGHTEATSHVATMGVR